jgi:NitT/TauT family transport system permease protein
LPKIGSRLEPDLTTSFALAQNLALDPYNKAVNARMLGARQKQLLRTVYLPSATAWVFSSLHTSVGLAFVGAVVGEYLGSARGVGYLIQQAEGTFDVNTVFAGIVVLTVIALLLDALVGRVERRLMKWQPRRGETEKL